MRFLYQLNPQCIQIDSRKQLQDGLRPHSSLKNIAVMLFQFLVLGLGQKRPDPYILKLLDPHREVFFHFGTVCIEITPQLVDLLDCGLFIL